MNKAYVFQEKFTGVQIYIYHKNSVDKAFEQLKIVTINSDNWIYIGTNRKY